MGRELRRKQEKKQGKIEKVKKEEVKDINPYNDINKMLKTFGLLLGIILIIYFLIAVLITKEIEWFSKEDVKETIKVQDSILAKNSFMQTEEEYYVYYYDFNNPNKSVSSLLSVKLASSKIYQVDTSDAFNSNYVTEEEIGNSTAVNIDELKVVNPTLIKISNGEIVEYYETLDGIISYLE